MPSDMMWTAVLPSPHELREAATVPAQAAVLQGLSLHAEGRELMDGTVLNVQQQSARVPWPSQCNWAENISSGLGLQRCQEFPRWEVTQPIEPSFRCKEGQRESNW